MIDTIQTIVIPIGGGEEQTVSVDWTVPQATSLINLFVVVDPSLAQEDRDLTNNTVSLQILAPDIIVSEVTLQKAGFTHIVTARITNHGPIPAGNFEVELRQDDPDGDIILDGRHLFELQPDSYNDITFTLTDLPWGVVNLSIEVDKNNDIDEFDEDNNIRAIRIENYAPADFDVDEDVDITDLAELAYEWLETGDYLKADISPVFIGDDKVDLSDLAEFGKYWMVE